MLLALKYEGIDLQILAEALPKIPCGDLITWLRESPTGIAGNIFGRAKAFLNSLGRCPGAGLGLGKVSIYFLIAVRWAVLD